MDALVSDDELVFLARSQHEEARIALQNKMQMKQSRMIRKLLFEHRSCGLEESDLQNIALHALNNAIESYDEKRSVFDAYYHLILQRELVNEMKKFNTHNHNVINTAVSLDYVLEEGTVMADIVGEEDREIKSQLDDFGLQLLEDESHHLTVQEKQMVAYYRLGYSFSAIGRMMNLNYRIISKILTRLYKLKPEAEK
jgi:DNA-directed RNA polymerase specialized sigma subunit